MQYLIVLTSHEYKDDSEDQQAYRGFFLTAVITDDPSGGRLSTAVSSDIAPLRIVCARGDGGRKPVRMALASSV